MFERMTTFKVEFKRETHLRGVDQPVPAGIYDVETEEEMISGLSFVAYRRVRTSIVMPCASGAHQGRQVVDISPDDLASALRQDGIPDAAPVLRDREWKSQ